MQNIGTCLAEVARGRPATVAAFGSSQMFLPLFLSPSRHAMTSPQQVSRGMSYSHMAASYRPGDRALEGSRYAAIYVSLSES